MHLIEAECICATVGLNGIFVKRRHKAVRVDSVCTKPVDHSFKRLTSEPENISAAQPLVLTVRTRNVKTSPVLDVYP